MINSNGVFLREWVRDPARVGAVTPASRRLAARLAAPVPCTGSPLVVELGPGTGAVTAAIQHRLGGRGRHLAVDINPRFAERLRSRFAGVDVVVADAVDLPDLLATRGLPRADVVVSALPWAVLGRAAQRRLMEAITASLDPQGAFTTFAYLHARWSPPGQRLRRLLHDAFEEVVPGRTVWMSLPPALVYHARRCRPARAGRPALGGSISPAAAGRPRA